MTGTNLRLPSVIAIITICVFLLIIGFIAGLGVNITTLMNGCVGTYEQCHIPEDAVIDNTIYSLYRDATTKSSLDQIKDDAYTRGHIDSRASVIGEQMNRDTGVHLGVREGYEPSPYPQWREYANYIARNKCEKQTTMVPVSSWYNEWDYNWTYPTPPFNITTTTTPDDAVITGVSWHSVRQAAGASP